VDSLGVIKPSSESLKGWEVTFEVRAVNPEVKHSTRSLDNLEIPQRQTEVEVRTRKCKAAGYRLVESRNGGV